MKDEGVVGWYSAIAYDDNNDDVEFGREQRDTQVIESDRRIFPCR